MPIQLPYDVIHELSGYFDPSHIIARCDLDENTYPILCEGFEQLLNLSLVCKD